MNKPALLLLASLIVIGSPRIAASAGRYHAGLRGGFHGLGIHHGSRGYHGGGFHGSRRFSRGHFSSHRHPFFYPYFHPFYGHGYGYGTSAKEALPSEEPVYIQRSDLEEP